MNRFLQPSRRTTSAAISLVGLVVFILHLPHTSANLDALLTADVIPLGLAFSLIYLGVLLGRTDIPERHVGRVLWWTLGMLVIMATVGMLFAFHEAEDGSSVFHIFLVFSSFGGVIGFVIGWYDVQEKRKARELKGFKNAVEEAGHSVMITDSDGIIEYVNPAFLEQTGYETTEVTGRTPGFLNSDTHEASFFADMWDTITAGEIWEGEVINVDKNGEQYTINQTIAPIAQSDGGPPDRFVAVNRDITELKAYEAELERQNERLEEFASVVSHDLRNPLSIAKGYTEILRDDPDESYIAEVESSLDRMAHIIDDVLTLAREGESLGEKTTGRLDSIAAQAWSNVSTADATLTVSLDETVEADVSRLLQAFENLFRNAIEHGGDDVTVSVGRTADGFFVEDDGPGIPVSERARVLEQGYSTGTNGTGLGLCIVQQVVTAHGWTLSITDGSSGGARFEVDGVFTETIPSAPTKAD